MKKLVIAILGAVCALSLASCGDSISGPSTLEAPQSRRRLATWVKDNRVYYSVSLQPQSTDDSSYVVYVADENADLLAFQIFVDKNLVVDRVWKDGEWSQTTKEELYLRMDPKWKIRDPREWSKFYRDHVSLGITIRNSQSAAFFGDSANPKRWELIGSVQTDKGPKYILRDEEKKEVREIYEYKFAFRLKGAKLFYLASINGLLYPVEKTVHEDKTEFVAELAPEVASKS